VRWRKVLRDFASNPSRTWLVVLSIAVGIFASGAILGARQVLVREFDRGFADSRKASITFAVSGVEQGLIDYIAARDDVISAEGELMRYARIRTLGTGDATDTPGPWEMLEIHAFDDFNRQANVIEPLSVRVWPPGEGEVIVEAAALAVFDLEMGDYVEIDTSDRIAAFRVAGFAHDINAIPTRFFRQITAYISTDSLKLLDMPDVYNIINIQVDPELSRQQATRIANDIKTRVIEPVGVQVTSTSVPDPGAHFLGDIFRAVSALLLVMALMALALSVFLVVTTVSAILIQHTRQIGIMKAIGARRSQIARLYFGLVFLFGACALLIGLPTGLAFGYFFIEYAGGVLNFRIISYMFPAWVFGVLVAIGLFLPLLAAAVPIMNGVRRPIVEALNANALLPNFGGGLVDRTLARIRWLSRPAALALRTTFMRKGRLAMTLTTLVLAAGVVMAVFSAHASLTQTVDDIGTRWNYDAFVKLAHPVPASTLLAESYEVTGVVSAEVWFDGYSIISRPDGTRNEFYFSIGFPADSDVAQFEYMQGRSFESGEKGVILNNELFNEEPYLTVGSYVDLEVNGQEVRRKVIGVMIGGLSGPMMYFERDDLAELMGAPGLATRSYVRMDNALAGPTTRGLLSLGEVRYENTPDTERAYNQRKIADALEARFDAKGFAVNNTLTFIEDLDEVRTQLGILTTFLVIMASALAAVGVIGLSGSMTLSVVESTREIGIMRAIGAGHRAIFGIYITQGMVVGTISWVFGAILSWPLSIVLIEALIAALGMPLSYRFSYGGVALTLVLMWVISVLGSVLPAWAASQISIRDAISYE